MPLRKARRCLETDEKTSRKLVWEASKRPKATLKQLGGFLQSSGREPHVTDIFFICLGYRESGETEDFSYYEKQPTAAIFCKKKKTYVVSTAFGENVLRAFGPNF